MEILFHYVWQHRLCGNRLRLTDGTPVEVVDPGVHNLGAGPDFFNAKIRSGGMLWVGNVEIHERSSDWRRHGHGGDAAYNNVVLHVVGEADCDAVTADGKILPQTVVAVPGWLAANYRELTAEDTYPPCYRVIPSIDKLSVRSWLSRLSVERLEVKMERVDGYLRQTAGDWERAFFVTLSRNFGFGTNADAFERWALSIDPQAVGKHRDDILLVEAFFFGQAGLLEDGLVPESRQDAYYRRLRAEYAFLRAKFGLVPLEARMWKFGRLRPQNFPYVRLSQLARLYHGGAVCFSRLLEARDAEAMRSLFSVGVTDYWQTHYAFGEESVKGEKTLRRDSLNLLIINTASPVLFAYARHTADESLAERAFSLLESLPAERNYITRCWERAGISADCAADSQALIQLRSVYCDRRDCLRCRFGAEYLRMGRKQ